MDLHQLQKMISSYFPSMPDGQQRERDQIIEASLEFKRLKKLILEGDH
jgi:hypothetical protein